jgi:hypothetical protein
VCVCVCVGVCGCVWVCVCVCVRVCVCMCSARSSTKHMHMDVGARKQDRHKAKYELMHAVQTLNTDDESVTCIRVRDIAPPYRKVKPP